MKLRFRCVAVALLMGAVSSTPRDAGAVNLVPNDSFENYTSCPTGFSQMYQGVPWDAPTAGTSDYYNACASGPNTPDVPSNNFGFQNARTGVGHAGFIVYSPSTEYREYIEAPLNSALVANATYDVKFYVSLSDNADTAVDRLGAYFSVGSVGPVGNWNPLPYTPQVESPGNTFLNDKTNWVLISGSFVAGGGETHIVIGSFRDDANTPLQPQAGSWPGSNYYIDDVSVELQAPTVQACCGSDGVCFMELSSECLAAGGSPAGPGTTCDSQPCDPVPVKKSSWGAVKKVYR